MGVANGESKGLLAKRSSEVNSRVTCRLLIKSTSNDLSYIKPTKTTANGFVHSCKFMTCGLTSFVSFVAFFSLQYEVWTLLSNPPGPINTGIRHVCFARKPKYNFRGSTFHRARRFTPPSWDPQFMMNIVSYAWSDHDYTDLNIIGSTFKMILIVDFGFAINVGTKLTTICLRLNRAFYFLRQFLRRHGS